jgi:hypothetical protein
MAVLTDDAICGLGISLEALNKWPHERPDSYSTSL